MICFLCVLLPLKNSLDYSIFTFSICKMSLFVLLILGPFCCIVRRYGIFRYDKLILDNI